MVNFIAKSLGITVKILFPTIHGLELENKSCEIVMASIKECDNSADCSGMSIFPKSSNCSEFNSMVSIDIIKAPHSDNANCHNFVETFKCMIMKYIKISDVCFLDSWKGNPAAVLPDDLLNDRNCG